MDVQAPIDHACTSSWAVRSTFSIKQLRSWEDRSPDEDTAFLAAATGFLISPAGFGADDGAGWKGLGSDGPGACLALGSGSPWGLSVLT